MYSSEMPCTGIELVRAAPSDVQSVFGQVQGRTPRTQTKVI